MKNAAAHGRKRMAAKFYNLIDNNHMKRYIVFVMLLSHGVIVRQLDETDIRVLLNEAISKYKSKKQMEDMCSLWYLSPTAGLCLSILEKDGLLIKSNSDLQLFQQTFMTEDIEILERIIEESEKRIKL